MGFNDYEPITGTPYGWNSSTNTIISDTLWHQQQYEAQQRAMEQRVTHQEKVQEKQDNTLLLLEEEL